MPMNADDQASRRELRDLLIIALIAVLIVAWGATIFFLVGNRPTNWDYGAHPYVPGESYQTTHGVPKNPQPPPQVELPPAPRGSSR
jgi:predicted metal-binding membrane protein